MSRRRLKGAKFKQRDGVLTLSLSSQSHFMAILHDPCIKYKRLTFTTAMIKQ